MKEIYQKTLSKAVVFEGLGLHSGQISKIKVHPLKEDQGIIFKRTDIKRNNIIKANYTNVSSTKLCTTLENKYGARVSTVEHLLAALYIVGVDNALIEIDSDEVPIMDGSARDFIKVLTKVKTKSQLKKRKYLKVEKKIEFKDGERSISIEPHDNSLEVEFQLDYENKIIGKQKNIVNFSKNDLSDVINSRTFCIYSDIEKIKKIGLAKGGSLKNAVVVDHDKIINEGGLRNGKEFVNHKILDLAGDFLLSGYRILGKVKCYQGGHQLTNLFLRKIFSKDSILNFFEYDEIIISKKIKSNTLEKLAVNA
tara:strand:- start:217 stop:1143 length:927 start_codon:yes stop_codon:yes gene_type:complete